MVKGKEPIFEDNFLTCATISIELREKNNTDI